MSSVVCRHRLGRNASSARCSGAHARRVALGEPRRQPVEEQVDRTRRRRPAAPPRGLADLQHVRGAREAGRRRSPLRALRGRSRAPARRRAARGAWPPRAAAAARRCRGSSANAICARSRCSRARWSSSSGASSAVASSSSAASGAPASSLACAAASARAPRRAGSGVSSAARSRNAAAAASPPRACARSAERSSSAATSSSGPDAACARCQARRSGSASGSVASASARCTSCRSSRRRRPVDGRAHQRMAEAHARAELDQARGLRQARSASAPMPSRSAARQSSVASPTGSAAAISSSRCVSAGSASSRRRKLCSMRLGQRPRRREARTRPPAPPASAPRQLEQRERVAAGLGDDPVADPLVQRARYARREQLARIAVREPLDDAAPASPSSTTVSVGSRTAKTIATRSASRRRATNASACAEARSSHCASSTRHRQRPRLGRLGQQAEHGEADEEADPARCRAAVRTPREAHRAAGPGRWSSPSSIGAHS